MRNATDTALQLPELREHIISFLDPGSVARASQVNRDWHDSATSERLWRRIYGEVCPASTPRPATPVQGTDASWQAMARPWLGGWRTGDVACTALGPLLSASLQGPQTAYLPASPGLPDPSVSARHLALPAEPHLVLSFGHRHTFQLWDTSTQPATSVRGYGHKSPLRGMLLHPDTHDRLLTWSEDGALAVWDLRAVVNGLKAARRVPTAFKETAVELAGEFLTPVFIRKGSNAATYVSPVSRVLVEKNNPHRVLTWDDAGNVHAFNFTQRPPSPMARPRSV